MSDNIQDRPVYAGTDESELRARAIKRIEARRGLGADVLAYVLVNTMLVVIWYVTGADFFWPIFPILGWGIGVVFHVWDVMSPGVDERQIQAEMDRLGRLRVCRVDPTRSPSRRNARVTRLAVDETAR